ncbi:hypothetical protein H0I23_05790 [Cellulophaga sp. HaHaR_3_176]|uniref:hypothetical protein n=1 Tax=Cellulophaga sp. HaHaR_3_176 TaxID=1942464 RepID=UPI001C1F3F09|nr:hypothetical protein [Cellulophaga sp. HaHaR_3_176]QWX85148.1 hypothetical protein H0I23_05790 [Cellulophaga sp. HaHaR_3_176]
MKVTTIWAFALLLVCCTINLNAQNSTKNTASKNQILEEEDEGPLMYKFEPSYTTSEEKRKVELKENRALIDSLDISDRKRKKLLKRMFSKDFSKYLSEIVTVKNEFEDSEE